MRLPRFRPGSVALAAALIVFGASTSATAASDAGSMATSAGQPVKLTVQPAIVTLTGPRSWQQLIITGCYADHSLRDLTHQARIRVIHATIAAVRAGLVEPRGDGDTTLFIEAGGKSVRIPVVVREFADVVPVSFRRELIAAMSVGGCNAGACHGTPSGKNGFHLSLRGDDPDSDYLQLTRDALGRRTGALDPTGSLMLEKALGRVPHEGGQRFAASSIPAEIVRAWLDQGLPDDQADLPALTQIEVLPGPRVLAAPARSQQLAVQAHFADGSVRDVTRLTVFSSSDPSTAAVNADGLVDFQRCGEAAILCRYLDRLATVRLCYLERPANFRWPNPPENNYVDHFVFDKLKTLGILPSEVCSDADFVRRVFMDVCGILPTPAETSAFLASADADKRASLIDALLARREYADFWTLKWSDVLRSQRKTFQVKGVHVFQYWLREHVERNTPFDQVVRQLLTASGSTGRNPPANYYRAARDPEALAETTAQLFCGVRLQCARCHNHPFERWTQDDYYRLAAFFARVRQKPAADEAGDNPQTPTAEIIYWDRAGEVVQPRSHQVSAPKFLGGPAPAFAAEEDRRQVLAVWLTSRANPLFARSLVNRIWFHLNRRGIVEPVDDFRDSNPPANDALLDALAEDFAAHGYDVKHLIRVIANSRTYQLSARTNNSNRDDARYFSHAVSTLYTAEQLLDAIGDVTGLAEKYPGMPAGTRALQLPDGDAGHPFLKTFGQPGRELPCECEREADSSIGQALQLINGETINRKLRASDGRVKKMLAAHARDDVVLRDLYLAALSRPPSAEEASMIQARLRKTADRAKCWEDIEWALLNSKEFLFRH